MTPSHRTKIFSLWTAEFKDPVTEQSYLQELWKESLQQVRLVCLIMVFYLSGLQFLDLVATGLTEAFWPLLAIRAVMAAPFAVLFVVAFHTSNFRAVEGMITFSHVIFISGLVMTLRVEPTQAVLVFLNLTVVTLSLFILTPGRLFWIGMGALIGLAVIVMLIAAQHILPWSDLVRVVTIGTLAQIVGAAGCYRLKIMRRRDYLMMLRARKTAEDLRKEVQSHAKSTESALRNEKAFRRLFDLAPVPLALVDAETFRVNQGNAAFARLIGAEPHDLDAMQAFRLFKNASDLHVVRKAIIEYGVLEGKELTLTFQKGKDIPILLSCFFIMFDGQGSIMMSLTDISQQREAQKKLEELASTDPLTGLANRRHFMQRSGEMTAHAKRYFSPYSVILLDIDHFKRINDSYGHDVGDFVLTEVTSLIQDGTAGAGPHGAFRRGGIRHFPLANPH